MVQDVFGEGLSFVVGQIFADPFGIQTGFVHAEKADGRKMVFKASEVTFGIRIEALVQKLGDNCTFGA